MLFRLLIFAIAGFILYRMLRLRLIATGNGRRPLRKSGSGQIHDIMIDDIMVRDPICGTFIPKREGLTLRTDDEDYYFCSTACREQFERNNRSLR